MSRASEGMTTCPENPAMNKPNATPISPKVPGEIDVCAGLQRLPGESDFENPSMNITAVMSNADPIPSKDVNESTDNGMKTVGTKMKKEQIL